MAKLPKTALNKATVTLSKTSVTYIGKAQKPSVTVKIGSVTVPSNQYTVTYSANTNVGTEKIVIKTTAKATYVSGSVTKTFKITKANNPMIVSPASKSFTVAVCKKKAQSVTIKASKAQGKVTYKSSSKYLTVSAKGNANYNSGLKL